MLHVFAFLNCLDLTHGIESDKLEQALTEKN